MQSTPSPLSFTATQLAGRSVVLIVGGGVAAYKGLELIRRLRERGCQVRPVLTQGGAQFVTPLALQALAEHKVYADLFSLTDESEMGHIRLSRESDLIVVAPATADLMARMAGGHADDLATTLLLASDKPVLIAPSMNRLMWAHPATQANLATLKARGIHTVGPAAGDLACGEVGSGRLAEVPEMLAAIEALLLPGPRPLQGLSALVTSGPTREPIDPVRYLSNHSSGRQGHAIAAALAEAGADVTLVSGPVALAPPPSVRTLAVETALEMQRAVEAALPVDIAVFAAAVADWRVATVHPHKLKKGAEGPPALTLVPNPDILAGVAQGARRPRLVVGFAAETQAIEAHAAAKRIAKGADWVLANDVGAGTDTFGGADNRVTLISQAGAEPWPALPKAQVARQLAQRIAQHFAQERS